jgi:osomolarity two-component system sensor histidine kinase NIK1
MNFVDWRTSGNIRNISKSLIRFVRQPTTCAKICFLMERRMATPPYKILIVDDNEPIRDLLTTICSLYDLNTECVNNGQEAVNAFEKDNFDIVLMDLDMPVMGGFEATRVIRQFESDRNCKRTPIIAISGTAKCNPHRMCLEAGMDGFLSKPIVLSEMFDVIGSVIDL